MTSEEQTIKMVDITFERATRKKRATNEMIKEFAKWCFDNEAFNKYTNGKIRQMYISVYKFNLS